MPEYPTIGLRQIPNIAAILLGRPRSFRQDALRLIRQVHPPPVIRGMPPASCCQGAVVAVNHYHRPGFGAWWIALSVAAAIEHEMHWMMTSAWIYPDRLRSWTVTPVSRWALTRIARSYGFTSSPPMPARAHEFAARAAAVRQLLRTLDRIPSPVLGIAPEGFDSTDGTLNQPPEGVSHLFQHLNKREMRFIPVGVYEEDGRLITQFGAPLQFGPSTAEGRDSGDAILERVMHGIAACLPASMRGCYE
jgi:hypothetical protein